MDVVTRPGREQDVGQLNDVERDGDRRYAGYAGIPEGFDDVVPVASLELAARHGRLFVAVDRASPESVLGFALVEVIDGLAHLAQLSVRRALQGRGVGRQLIEAVASWARDHAMGAVTLCTFADVTWNRPLYEHLGFTVVPEKEWSPGLRAVFAADAELGLDLDRRCVMRLELPA
jgi:GNAT superfamily N-acetyltransferase